MTDLIERLRRWSHDVNAVPASDLMDEAADEIERLRLELFMRPTPNILVQAARWILVSERLPEGEDDVLVAFRHDDGSASVDIAYTTWLTNPPEWRFYRRFVPEQRPECWMPLPEPPEVK